MKKLILFFLIAFEIAFGFNIKYQYYINPNMNEQEIIKKLKTLPDGTAITFPKEKKYFFNNKSIILNKEVVLFLNYSSLNDLNITFEKPFMIFEGILKNTHLNISNVQEFGIWNCYLSYNNILNIKSSNGWINNINLVPNKQNAYLNDVYQNINSNYPYNKININTSFVQLTYSKIYSPLNIVNSNIKIDKVIFQNFKTGDFIYLLNSHLFINQASFYNTEPGESEDYATFLTFENSEAVVENSSFTNNWRGVLSINSKSFFKNNKFNNLNFGMIFTKKSNSYIVNNTFNDAIGSYSWSIGLYEDSKAFIKENDFKNVYIGIDLNEKTSANIDNNIFESLYKQKYTRKSYKPWSDEIVTDYYKGKGIYLDKYAFANIENNRLASDYSYLVKADYKAYYFEANNIGNISGGDEVDNKIAITVDQVSNFISGITKYENYFNNEFNVLIKEIKQAKYLKTQIYEGYLNMPQGKELIGTIRDDEIVIDNGTYLKIKQDGNIYKIISPKEYQGVILDKLPPLKNKDNFTITPLSNVLADGRIKVNFLIMTNKKINKIEFNNQLLTLKNTGTIYTTKPRIMKSFKKAHLIIYLENKQLSYQCVINKYKYLICNKMKKDDL